MSGLQLNFSLLKEPLGFIKVLEWFFSIFSFATCGGYSGDTHLLVSCVDGTTNLTNNASLTATFGYPFRLNKAPFKVVEGKVCGEKMADLYLTGDYSSPAQFYVSIAVLAFLYCMGALVLYLGYRHLYQGSPKLPLIDFIITAVFAFMWLVSSSAWAKGLTDVKYATDPSIIAQNHCPNPYTCQPGTESRMGSLNISVAFGFLNLILWAGNAWFVYKETSLHTQSQPPNPEQGPPS
ncbi:synaptophysin-like protein 1 [Hyperolius riggenbachi]|uniref:synaptophysin-like protein 1 n=1 Tax=Hyperolius riggenbachi TaxID=752182 RepID=UPI0035A38CB6